MTFSGSKRNVMQQHISHSSKISLLGLASVECCPCYCPYQHHLPRNHNTSPSTKLSFLNCSIEIPELFNWASWIAQLSQEVKHECMKGLLLPGQPTVQQSVHQKLESRESLHHILLSTWYRFLGQSFPLSTHLVSPAAILISIFRNSVVYNGSF